MSKSTQERSTEPGEAVQPVAWMRDKDDDSGSISTMTACVTSKVRDLWLRANPRQVERYTIPLYTAASLTAARREAAEEIVRALEQRRLDHDAQAAGAPYHQGRADEAHECLSIARRLLTIRTFGEPTSSAGRGEPPSTSTEP